MNKFIQQEIDWEKAVHVRENTPENERHLNENRYHFTGQAAVVLSWLQKGLKVNSLFAQKNNITDLQRRIGDLGEFGGVDIDREYTIAPGGKVSRMLIYFLPENRIKFIKRGVIPNKKRWWYSEKYTPPHIIERIKKTQNEHRTEAI
jgi:hypothetical protein